MDDQILAIKLRHISDSVRGALTNPNDRYFDPAMVAEWFTRYAVIRNDLKAAHSEIFSDLKDRQLPQSSGTTDHEGRGYILRRELEQLQNDCQYCQLLLQKAQEPQRDEKLARVGKRIFVSHASKDKPLVEFFVEQVLRLGLEVATDDIFCTSLEGMGIRDGDDFREVIRLRLDGARLVLLVVTPNYKASEVCLNEMGAAWASNKPVIALAVEPIDYKSVGVFMEPTQIPKLSDPISLSNLKDRITKELGLPGTKTDLWDAKKMAFLSGLKAKVAECQFSTILSRGEIDNIVAENRNLRARLAIASAPQDGEALVAARIASDPDQVASEFNLDEMASFQVLKEAAKKALEPFQTVVMAIILSDYSKHDYQPPQGFEGDLSSAIRKHVLLERDDGYQSNRENKDVENAFTCLKKLEAFLQVTKSPTFHEVYDKKFHSEANIKSQAFWEEHFDFQVPE